MRISFAQKLIFSYVFVILASFSFIAFFLSRNLEANSLQNIQSSLITQAGLIENRIPLERLKQEDIPYLEALAKEFSGKTSCRITIIKTTGRVLADSETPESQIQRMENHLYRPEVKTALTGAVGVDKRYSSTLKINMLYIALPLKDKNEITGILRLALPLESVRKTLFALRRTVFTGLFFALALAFILASLITGRTVQTIKRMIRVSRRFSEGDFSHKMIDLPADEIGELASTLNKMASDLEDKIKQIKAQNQKLSAVFNSMIEGIIVVDKDLRIVSINPEIEKLFNILKRESEGKIFLEVIRNNDIFEILSSVLNEGKAKSGEISLIAVERRVFEVNATPILDNKSAAGCLVVIHDITEIRRLETVRSDFVANVSHELKTPLTSIKGFVETLLEGALDDRENNRKFLMIIHDHAERLDKLVNDLLSLSHLESKEITLKRSDFNLKEQFDEIISGFRAQSKKKAIDIKNELPSSLQVTADRDRIEQVITNLVDNAIKFNKEKGLVRIYSEEINGRIKVSVEDSGIGIPVKDIPRIFERFYRVDKARSRELGGTGLGLSIVKHIIELHNGSAGVESAEGFGSKFWFILPQ